MTTEEDTIGELLASLPPRARAGVRAALAAANDETDVGEDAVALGKLAAAIAGGASPPFALIVGGIQGAIGLLKWGARHRKAKRRRSRRRGTAAGLAAYHANKSTVAREQARKAGRSIRAKKINQSRRNTRKGK